MEPPAPQPYTIEYTTAAAKELSKLDRPIARRVGAAIGELAVDPRPPGCKKLVGSDSLRIRVGNYRVVYIVADAVVTVTVVRIGHRSNVYDK